MYAYICLRIYHIAISCSCAAGSMPCSARAGSVSWLSRCAIQPKRTPNRYDPASAPKQFKTAEQRGKTGTFSVRDL